MGGDAENVAIDESGVVGLQFHRCRRVPRSDRPDADRGIQRRAEGGGEDTQPQAIPLLCRHTVGVDIAGLFDDAIDRDGQALDASLRGGGVFEQIGEWTRPQQERRGRVAEMFERAGLRGHRDRFVAVAQRIPEQLDCEGTARLTAWWVGSQRPAVGADVDAVGDLAWDEHGAADLHERESITRQPHRGHRILHVQGRVVAGGQFVARVVEDADAEVVFGVAVANVGDANRIDLDGEPLARDGGHFVEIDVAAFAATQPAADRDVGRDACCRVDGVVRVRCLLVLVDDGKRRDVERRHGRKFPGGADAEGMLAQRAVGRDLKPAREPAVMRRRRAVAAITRNGDGLEDRFAGADSRAVEDHLLRLFETVARHRHLDRRAARAAAGRDAGDVIGVDDLAGDRGGRGERETEAGSHAEHDRGSRKRDDGHEVSRCRRPLSPVTPGVSGGHAGV